MTPKKPSRLCLSLRNLLRAPTGDFALGDFDSADTPGLGLNGRDEIPGYMRTLRVEISDLQERLFASGRGNRTSQRVLLVLEGLNTAGKGAVIRHLFGLIDPRGIHLKAFGPPSEEELAHDFLWRVRNEVPAAGMIGIFDRSHYQDVLVARVEGLVSVDEWRRRYEEINAFEAGLARDGTILIKCFLNVGKQEQRRRLLERLADPTKHWKYHPSDVQLIDKWSAYMEAYTDAIGRCGSASAPWYIVPADRRWYRDWAVAQVLHEHLSELEVGWPVGTFDIQAEIERLRD